MLVSPVPTQTMSGFDGATVTSPMALEAACSNTGRQLTPRSSLTHSPPQHDPA